ncbi:MAG: Phospholipid methyltransferase [Acidobacteria bacterium]|nr:Phospholipid methyltransferase [Acidobacteriota bacterium]
MRKARLAVVVLAAASAAWVLMRQGTAGQTLAAGLALLAVGLPLVVVSRIQLGRAFSVAPRATVLVARGVYSKIPHPMYAFLDVALLGLVILLRRRWLVAAWLALVAVHVWAAHREGRVLEQAFGEEYRRYRAQAWW